MGGKVATAAMAAIGEARVQAAAVAKASVAVEEGWEMEGGPAKGWTPGVDTEVAVKVGASVMV